MSKTGDQLSVYCDALISLDVSAGSGFLRARPHHARNLFSATTEGRSSGAGSGQSGSCSWHCDDRGRLLDCMCEHPACFRHKPAWKLRATAGNERCSIRGSIDRVNLLLVSGSTRRTRPMLPPSRRRRLGSTHSDHNDLPRLSALPAFNPDDDHDPLPDEVSTSGNSSEPPTQSCSAHPNTPAPCPAASRTSWTGPSAAPT